MGVQKQLHSFLNSALDWVSCDRSVGTTVGLDDYHNTHISYPCRKSDHDSLGEADGGPVDTPTMLLPVPAE